MRGPPAGRAPPFTREGSSTLSKPFSRSWLIAFFMVRTRVDTPYTAVVCPRPHGAGFMAALYWCFGWMSFGSAPLRSPRVAHARLRLFSSERRPPPAEGHGIYCICWQRHPPALSINNSALRIIQTVPPPRRYPPAHRLPRRFADCSRRCGHPRRSPRPRSTSRSPACFPSLKDRFLSRSRRRG